MRRTLRIILATAAMAVVVPPVLAPGPAAAAGPDYGPNTCLVGWVWREAFPGDYVCVTPATRAQARADNAAAAARVDPRGAYGPRSCVSGYVWREARASDLVCVTPATRAVAKADNAAAASRRASVLASWSTWLKPDTTTCDGDVCTRQFDGGPRHRVVVTNVNVGRVWLGVYVPGVASPRSGEYVTATRVAGRPGGVAVFRTNLPICSGTPNAYFRVKDMTSGRWSLRRPVSTRCGSL